MIETLLAERHPYHQQKLAAISRRLADPQQSIAMRVRDTLLFRGTDRETQRRADLFPLSAQLKDKVEVDEEGNLYYNRWQLAQVVEHPKILGQKLAAGKTADDYYDHPPLKTSRKLIFVYTPQGIEQLLGVADHVLVSEHAELTFIDAANAWVRALRRMRVHYTDLNPTQALEFRQNGLALAQQLGSKLQDPHKKKIVEMISKGAAVVDGEGRIVAEKNFIAGLSREFGIEVRALKRREAVKAAIGKYQTVFKQVDLERTFIRKHLEGSVDDLTKLLTEPIFADPNFGQKSRNEWIGQYNSVATFLAEMSSAFQIYVTARPYVLGTRKVIESLGTITLPPGQARELQIKRAGQKTHWLRMSEILSSQEEKKAALDQADQYATVRELLSEGKFAAARQIILYCKDRILQKMLDVNFDFAAVKKDNHGGQASTWEIDGNLVRLGRERLGLGVEDITMHGISPYYLALIEKSSSIRIVSWKARALADRLEIPLKELKVSSQR